MWSTAFLYDAARKYFVLGSCIAGPLTFFIDAPFGKFSPSGNSIFLVDGIKSWIVMELVSPFTFLVSFLRPSLSPTFPQILLACIYLLHYTNRALVSPLRTPSRSKSHLIVPAFGVSFNIINGSLMGTYLASQSARAFLDQSRPTFVLGLALWTLGFAGNILHDEILLNIRRNATKEKYDKAKGEHYAIPQGWLYKYLSYPNYFCEWIEWAGFALAAAPLPTFSKAILTHPLEALLSPVSNFAPTLTPPYIFLLTEIITMTPRAVRGHKWYHRKFGAAYPRERKAVIPFLL